MEFKKNSPLEAFIGKVLRIKPQRLLNKGLLFTKENLVHEDRAVRAVKGEAHDELPKAAISIENIHGKESMVITMTDGNHRMGVACLKDEEIDVYVEGIWIGKKRWGFNKIKHQLKSLLGQENDNL